MSRPLVPGLDITKVAWQSVAEVYGGVEFHVEEGEYAYLLAEDPETGARTCLVKLPAGWHSPAPESHSSQQEEVLLAGDLSIGGEHHSAPAYWCFPAGVAHGPAYTDSGCIILASHDGPVDVTYHP